MWDRSAKVTGEGDRLRVEPNLRRGGGPEAARNRLGLGSLLALGLLLGLALPAADGKAADALDSRRGASGDLGWTLDSRGSLAEAIEDPTLDRILRTESRADPPAEPGGTSQEELDAIGEAMANPLSYLWLLFMQNDTIWYDGDVRDRLNADAKAQNTFLFNPVLSVQLTETWKTIIRPVIPINSFNTFDNVNISLANPAGVTGVERDRDTGIGDIVLWTAFSNSYKPPLVWGFGPTVMLNTATDDSLGSGRNAAGPMGMLVHISDKWIIGAVGQHWWSFSGEDRTTVETSVGNIRVDTADINLTDVQPILRYRLSPLSNIGVAPNWRYNWETDELSLPIGIGGDTLVKFGPLPVKLGLEAYYYVARDDDLGPEWQLRFLIIPVVPSPEWSRRPLF